MFCNLQAEKWNSLKFGLVLSGGGAKGAYEAGVIRAMYDLGYAENVTAVAGTSIGALNTLLFSVGGYDVFYRVWRELSYSDVLIKNDKLEFKNLRALIKQSTLEDSADTSRIAQVLGAISDSDQTPLTMEGIRSIIKRNINPEKIRNDERSYYVCAYNTDDLMPEYFFLNELSDEMMVTSALASAAIPYLFPPVEMNGKKYSDGGINNSAIGAQNGDKTPVRALASHRFDAIFVIYLNPGERVARSLFGNTPYFELYPSKHLESFKGSGTLNFTHGTIEDHIDLGYSDSMKVLGRTLSAFLSGKTLSELSGELNRENLQYYCK